MTNDVIRLLASESLEISDDPPCVQIAAPAPEALAVLGIAGGAAVQTIQGEPAYSSVVAWDRNGSAPYGQALTFVIEGGQVLTIEFVDPAGAAALENCATAVVLECDGPRLEDGDSDQSMPRVEPIESDSGSLSLEQLVLNSITRRQRRHETSASSQLQTPAVKVDSVETSGDDPVASEAIEAEPSAAIESTLPVFALVEVRDPRDRRPWFVSQERSKFEREMIARAARRAGPGSAVDATYNPYRVQF